MKFSQFRSCISSVTGANYEVSTNKERDSEGNNTEIYRDRNRTNNKNKRNN